MRGWRAAALPLGLSLAFGLAHGADWKAERERIDRLHVAAPFRIFYTLSGANALAERADADGDGTPDRIERLAAKLRQAHRVYVQDVGLAEPLRSPRYREQVRFIDIHFVRLSGKGSAGDGVHEFDYRVVSGDASGALVVTLSPDLKPESLTPEHELFHIFQYGYTSIKNGWLSEGTARWSEQIFAREIVEKQELPGNRRELDDLLNKSYGAANFWRRLTQLCEAPASGTTAVRGYRFMHALYENLGRIEQAASARRKLTPYDWGGREKSSPLNDRYILAAITQAAEDAACRKSDELARFLAVAAAYAAGDDDAPGADVTAALETLGSPFAQRYSDGADVYARNIWGMQAFGGAIYLGAGNAANAGPAPNAGPVPIIRYEPKTGRFVTEGSADDEQTGVFRIIDGQLHIPGLDAAESSRLGNFYRRGADGRWKKHRNLPHALHVFDMAGHDGKLFAALGTPQGAAVGVSADKGESWEVVPLGEKQRVWNLLNLDGTLYAVKQHLAKRYLMELSPAEQAAYFSVAELRGGSFKPRPDLKPAVLFPDMPLRAEKTTMLMRPVPAAGKVAYIGAYYVNNPFGVFVASTLKAESAAVRRVFLPKACVPADLLGRAERLYILCNREEEGGYRSVVLEARYDDPGAARELFHFAVPTLTRAFEELDGDFYFGLGYALGSQKNWKVEDISPDTGRVLRLRREQVPRLQ